MTLDDKKLLIAIDQLVVLATRAAHNIRHHDDAPIATNMVLSQIFPRLLSMMEYVHEILMEQGFEKAEGVV